MERQCLQRCTHHFAGIAALGDSIVGNRGSGASLIQILGPDASANCIDAVAEYCDFKPLVAGALVKLATDGPLSHLAGTVQGPYPPLEGIRIAGIRIPDFRKFVYSTYERLQISSFSGSVSARSVSKLAAR